MCLVGPAVNKLYVYMHVFFKEWGGLSSQFAANFKMFIYIRFLRCHSSLKVDRLISSGFIRFSVLSAVYIPRAV